MARGFFYFCVTFAYRFNRCSDNSLFSGDFGHWDTLIIGSKTAIPEKSGTVTGTGRLDSIVARPSLFTKSRISEANYQA